jgi:DNA-binding CsgD family transcriptional regulator
MKIRTDIRAEFPVLVHLRTFSASPNPYLVLSPRLEIIEVNEPYNQVTLTQPGELTGRDMFEAFPDNPGNGADPGSHTLRASLARVTDFGLPDRMPTLRYDVRDRDGVFHERWWEPINVPIIEDGRMVAILHHAGDVTHRQKQVNVAKSQLANLTPRESEVLQGLSRGLTTKELATELGISAKTVGSFRLKLLEKLGVRTQGALIRIGILAFL